MLSNFQERARSVASASVFSTVILSQIFTSNALAQDTFFSEGPQVSSPSTGTENNARIQAMLQNMSDHPLAGGDVHINLCGFDGLKNQGCGHVKVALPLPQLNNPLGYEVQQLRRKLALMVETADRGLDGMPLEVALKQGGMEVIDRFVVLMDERPTEFPKPETYFKIMDLHYDLMLAVEDADVPAMSGIIGSLREVVLQLEEDLFSEADKALRDAMKALQEALEEGASDELLEALSKELMNAMKAKAEEQKSDESLSPSEQQAFEDMQKLMEEMQKQMEEMGITAQQMAQMMMGQMGQMGQGSPGSPPSGAKGQEGEQPSQSYEEMLEKMKKRMEEMKEKAEYMAEIGAITEAQQGLRDRTLSTVLNEQGGNLSDEGFIENLEAEQGGLEQRLSELVGKMKKDRLPIDSLEVAEVEMDEAENDLDVQRLGEAVGDQDEALEALREGQQQMQQMMAMLIPGGGGPLSGTGPGGPPPPGELRRDSPLMNEEGELRALSPPNKDLGVSPSDGQRENRRVRDQILERQRGTAQSQGNSYLDRLLGTEGPGVL